MITSCDSLESLPNLGKTTVMWLRAIGIRDRLALAERGIYWAYLSMQRRGFRVTTAVLFSLEGALRNKPWRSFGPETKDQLLAELAAYRDSDALASTPSTGPTAAAKQSPNQVNRKPPARAPRKQRDNQSISAAESSPESASGR